MRSEAYTTFPDEARFGRLRKRMRLVGLVSDMMKGRIGWFMKRGRTPCVNDLGRQSGKRGCVNGDSAMGGADVRGVIL